MEGGRWKVQGTFHYSFHHLSPQHARRNLRTICLKPAGVVEADLVPARHLLARIIFLAVILVVSTDGAVGRHLPLLVRRDALGRAVLILDDDIDAALRQSEGGILIRLVLTHGEVAAITQDDADTILSEELLRDVVGIIIDGLPIVRRHGLHQSDAIAQKRTVDIHLIEPKPSHEGRSAFHRLVLQLELVPQITGGKP